MQQLFYQPQDIAWIIRSWSLDIQERFRFIDFIWKYEREYLSSKCQCNKRKFIQEIQNWMDYLNNQIDYKMEISKIKLDFVCIGSTLELANDNYFREADMFFKTLRLRILYFENRGYVTMKFRTVLRKYGYKRRSGKILMYFKRCLVFYHIQTYLCNNVECDIEEIDLDDRIIFRVA